MATNLAPRLPEELPQGQALTALPGGANQLLSRVGGSRALLPLGLAAIAIIAILMLTNWATAPQMVTILSGMPMDEIGQAYDHLSGTLMRPQIGPAGTSLLVPRDKAAEARVALAQQGLTSRSSPGFELFDQNSWGMTDFTQGVNFQRAMQGELERSISQMKGIESADVHLAIQESSFLQEGGPRSSASVLLNLRIPGSIDDSAVRAVQALVSGSVGGLATEDVSVLDNSGLVLTAGSGAEGLSDSHLKAREEIERHLEVKAVSILATMLGNGNAVVRVSADMNFDRTERTTQKVDPDDQITVSEGRSETIPGSPEQGASLITSNTVTETSRSTEQYLQDGPRIMRLSVAVLVNDVEVPSGDSVVYQSRTPQQLQAISDLVANAVGVDQGRGDGISVASAPFDKPDFGPVEVPDESLDMMAVASMAQRPLMGLIGLAMALFVGLKAVKTIPPPLQPQRLAQTVPQAAPRLEIVPERPTPVARPAGPPPPTVADPDMAAKMARAWMKDA
jgi:flagellar M-ring protein FliF